MAADLRELVRPATTVLLTQECQRGVVGPDSMIPALAEAARTSGALANVTRLVHAARAANVGVLHALAGLTAMPPCRWRSSAPMTPI
jgi:hypothetical protein